MVAVARVSHGTLPAAERAVERFMSEAGIGLLPIGPDETRAALDAFARFGKGRGHPAQLNMGDCFTYGCAAVRGLPILYVGQDFALTDLA